MMKFMLIGLLINSVLQSIPMPASEIVEEIEVINNEDEYQERYLFKQGLGIWEYSRQDKKGKIISSLKYQKKVLNND